jgi:hypothetical protein
MLSQRVVQLTKQELAAPRAVLANDRRHRIEPLLRLARVGIGNAGAVG